jgi:hypothetical protein
MIIPRLNLLTNHFKEPNFNIILVIPLTLRYFHELLHDYQCPLQELHTKLIFHSLQPFCFSVQNRSYSFEYMFLVTFLEFKVEV